MHTFSQQNGPCVTAMPHVNPVTHGDSGTREQSLSCSQDAVHKPLVPSGYIAPIGRSGLVSGTLRHSRETQSSDGDEMIDSDGSGTFDPRSQSRPTGWPEQATSATPSTTTSCRGW